MKKFALAMMAASAAVFGFGMVASAQGYDPAVTVDPASPDAGGAYTVTYDNCFVGETITFTQADSTPTEVTAPCEAVAAPASILGLLLPQQAALGSAVGSFTAAPTAPGDYTGTAAGVDSPSLPFMFTIAGDDTTTTMAPTTPTTEAPAAALPATGSNGIGTTTGIAIGLLAVGAGLFVVAQIRRRQEPGTVA